MLAKIRKHLVWSAIFLGLLSDSLALPASDAAGIRNALTISAVVGAERSSLETFYASRSFSPAWSEGDARLLQEQITRAGEEGLDPAVYILPPSAAAAAERDVLLTYTALAYARDVHAGRAAMRTRDADVELPPVHFDVGAELQTALQGHRLGEFLRTLPPPQPGYAALKAALAFYRGIAARGGWPVLREGRDFGPTVEVGASEALHQRLALEYPQFSRLDVRDQVKRFQADHGLAADGKVGGRTLAELNRPVEDRIEQIVVNMERWRWLPSRFENSFISINVPDANLSLILHDRLVLESRVVVGKPTSPTPILRATGAGVTVNPPWTVPASIARKEILPKLKANSDYLQQQDMVLLDGPANDPYGLRVPWRRIPAGTFPFRIQQHPGGKNALGTIKIELPNRFDIYLHDTPGKSAFARPVRDVSHGCVRVQAILPLTSYVLSENLDAMVKITDAIAAGSTRYFPFKTKVPVYFLYWTAFADKDGNIQFRPDIYGRDQRLIVMQRGMQPLRIAAAAVACQRG